MTNQSEIIDAWLQYLQHNKGRSVNTGIKYRGYLNKLAIFLDDHSVLLLEATPTLLLEFVGPEAFKQKLNSLSRRVLVAAIRGFYLWASERAQLIQDNPAKHIEYPAADKNLPVNMPLASAEKLFMQPDLHTLKGVRDIAMLALFITTGIRRSGLCSLNESNLLFDYLAGHEQLTLRVKEKGKKERLVPAPQEALLLIQAYLAHPDLEKINRKLPDGDRVLFVSLCNRTIPAHEYYGEKRRISPRAINDMVVLYGEKAGIPRDQMHPHALRHLLGSEMAEEGVDIQEHAALFGHSDIKTTAIYRQLAARSKRAAIEKANPMRKIRTPVTGLITSLNSKT